MRKEAFGIVARDSDPRRMELALDFRSSAEHSLPQLERERLEQLVGCLQLFVGHELPNVLVSCQAFARLLGEQASQLDAAGAQLVERLAVLTQKADRWSRRLAEIGRLLRASPWGPVVELEELVHEAVAEVNALGEVPAVAYRISDGMPAVGVSRSLLHAVLVQLLRNSARAVLTDQPGLVEVTAWLQQDGWRLQVKDNGRGLSPEQANLLLEPFAAARRPGASGAGLGFFLVRQAAARWGGSLRLHSEVGQGTTVEMFVPLGEDENLR